MVVFDIQLRRGGRRKKGRRERECGVKKRREDRREGRKGKERIKAGKGRAEE